MSEFDTLAQQANAAFEAMFNDAVVYTPAGGAAVTVTMEIVNQSGQRPYDDHGQRDVVTAMFLLPMRFGITPAFGDAITLDGKTYTVVEWQRATPDWQITATRTTAVKRAPAAYQEPPR